MSMYYYGYVKAKKENTEMNRVQGFVVDAFTCKPCVDRSLHLRFAWSMLPDHITVIIFVGLSLAQGM